MTLRDEAEDEKEGHGEHREDTEIHGIVQPYPLSIIHCPFVYKELLL